MSYLGLGEDWHPLSCPPTADGITQQVFPDGLCHPVFAAGDYVDPAAELWRRCLTDPGNCQLISGGLPVSAQPYRTPQPVTQAQIDASRAAQQYLNVAAPVPTVPAVTPGAGVPTASNYVGAAQGFLDESLSLGGFNVPMWGLLAAGVGALFLFGRGR